MSLRNSFNASGVRDFSKKAVMILLTGVAFTVGTGFAQEAHAEGGLLQALEGFTQRANDFSANVGGGAQQQRTAPPQVEKERSNAPWANDPAYQMEKQKLRLQAKPYLEYADSNYTSYMAACLTQFTGARSNIHNMPTRNSQESQYKLSLYNQANANFASCNQSTTTARNQTYSQWAQYFLDLDIRYAQKYNYQLETQQAQQQQAIQQQRQADGQTDSQKAQLCKAAELEAFQNALKTGVGDGKLPASHLCVRDGYVRR